MKNLMIILLVLFGLSATAQTEQCILNNVNTYLELKDLEVESGVWNTISNPFGVSSSMQSIRINEDLIIPSGVDLTIDGLTFEFGTLGRIIVESESTLTCLNASF